MLYLIYCTCGLWFPLVEYKSSVLVRVCVLSVFYISVFYLSIKVFVCCKLLQVTARVRYIWWQRWDPLSASRRQGPQGSTARQSAAGSTRKVQQGQGERGSAESSARATIHYPQVSGRATRGRPDRTKQRSSG